MPKNFFEELNKHYTSGTDLAVRQSLFQLNLDRSQLESFIQNYIKEIVEEMEDNQKTFWFSWGDQYAYNNGLIKAITILKSKFNL